jgi:hypothetical protein
MKVSYFETGRYQAPADKVFRYARFGVRRVGFVMSALLSGLPQTADISGRGRYFAFVPRADIRHKLALSSYGHKPFSLLPPQARRSDPVGLCPDANSAAAAFQCLLTLVQQRGEQHLQFRRLRAVDAGNDRVGHHQRRLEIAR